MLDIILAIAGIIMLLKGRMLVSSKSEVSPAVGRTLGAIALLPFTMAFSIGFLRGAKLVSIPETVENLFVFSVLSLVVLSVIIAIIFFRRPIRTSAQAINQIQQYTISQPSAVPPQIVQEGLNQTALTQATFSKKLLIVPSIILAVVVVMGGVLFFLFYTLESEIGYKKQAISVPEKKINWSLLEPKPYENPFAGFKIHPPKDWNSEEGANGLIVNFTGQGATVNVTSETVSPGVTFEDYITKTKYDFRSSEERKFLSEEKTTIGGKAAYIIETLLPINNVLIRARQILVMQKGVVYILTGAVRDSLWDTYKEVFESSLLSFEFLGD